MEKDQSKKRTKMRLPEYDYAQAGAYFVTIVTQNRRCLFGEIIESEMQLNDAGRMVEGVCRQISELIFGLELDIYQIMPNHFHGLFVLNEMVGADLRVCPDLTKDKLGQPQRVAPTSLPDVIQRFKSITTKRYIDGVAYHNWPSFNKRLWQRNYYDHIIRDEKDLQSVVGYILTNPQNWLQDEEYQY